MLQISFVTYPQAFLCKCGAIPSSENPFLPMLGNQSLIILRNKLNTNIPSAQNVEKWDVKNCGISSHHCALNI
jgi:hypothetical protein